MLGALLVMTIAATPRVAVLPFENSTGSEAFEPLRVGLADLVTADLISSEAVVVLERARLDAVLTELKLQQTRFFDKRTAEKLGQLIGANYVIAGTVVKKGSTVVVLLRLVSMKGVAEVSAQAEGVEDDLFAVEHDAVSKLLASMKLKSPGVVDQKASLAAVNDWASGVALAQNGKLDEAKTKLASAVRDAPDFRLAAESWAEVLKQLREVEKKRGSMLDERTVTLRTKLESLVDAKEPSLKLAARIALTNLALVELSRFLEGATFVPPGKRADVERLEAEFMTRSQQFMTQLEATPKAEPELDDATKALMEKATPIDLTVWDFATPGSVAVQIAAYLGSGRSPYRSDVPVFVVRPSVAQRSPEGLARARAAFEAAKKKVDAAHDTAMDLQLANEWAEMLVLLGRQPEAVARWQGFLDAHPDAEDFELIKSKMTAVMGLDAESEKDAQMLEQCDSRIGAATATRMWRSKGAAGLKLLQQKLEKCGLKDLAKSLPADELKRVGAQ